MIISDENDLQTLLREVTAGIEPDLALSTRARDGGRRLRVRRRRNAVLVAAGIAVLSIGGVTAEVTGVFDSAAHEPSPAAPGFDYLTDAPVRGDLAGDADYLADALLTWDTSHDRSPARWRGWFDDLRGESRVVWAGTTPSGPAAVVSQVAHLDPGGTKGSFEPERHVLVGFIGVDDDGEPTVVDEGYAGFWPGTAMSFYADPGRKSLVVLDGGEDIGISLSRTYHPDGTVTREFDPVDFIDGVAVVTIPDSVTTEPALTADGTVRSVTTDLDPNDVTLTTLPVRAGEATERSNGIRVSATMERSVFTDINRAIQLSDIPGQGMEILGQELRPVARTEMTVDANLNIGVFPIGYGATPDGRALVVGERTVGGDPGRIMAVLTDGAGVSTVIDGGAIVEPDAALPVRMTLPDGQGTIVGSPEGMFRYRLDGAWHDAGPGMALIPAAADRLEVFVPGAPEPHPVELPTP